MKTRLVLDANLIRKAALLTVTKEKAALVRLGLKAPIARARDRLLVAGVAPALEFPADLDEPYYADIRTEQMAAEEC